MSSASLELIIQPVCCWRGHCAELRAYDVNGGWFRAFCDCGAVWVPDGPEHRETVDGTVGAPFPRFAEVTPIEVQS